MREVVIRNNGIFVDLDKYGVTLLSHLEEDNDPEVITFKYGRMVKTAFVRAIHSASTLTVEWTVSGGNIDYIKSNIEKFKQKLYNCEIKFECENSKTYSCIMKSTKKEFINKEECILTTIFSFEKFSDIKKINISKSNQVIDIGGSKETPISFYIKAKEEVKNIVINDIEILSIPKGKTVIIDSFKGLILMDDSLYSNKVKFIEFPMKIGKYQISYNNTNIEIQIQYNERW